MIDLSDQLGENVVANGTVPSRVASGIAPRPQQISLPNSSEILMGFLGWATTRYETLHLGAKHDASPAVKAFEAFAIANDMPEFTLSYPQNIITPKE